jgi:hypothetical protein
MVFKKLNLTQKYDQGTITFAAKKGKLIDLDKLHESVWATRLSGGTSSGVVSLEVTAVGEVEASGSATTLHVAGSDRKFILVDDVKAKPADAKKSSLAEMLRLASSGKKVVSVTGYVEGWSGRWPGVLSKPPDKTPRLMVTSFQVASEARE